MFDSISEIMLWQFNCTLFETNSFPKIKNARKTGYEGWQNGEVARWWNGGVDGGMEGWLDWMVEWRGGFIVEWRGGWILELRGDWKAIW